MAIFVLFSAENRHHEKKFIIKTSLIIIVNRSRSIYRCHTCNGIKIHQCFTDCDFFYFKFYFLLDSIFMLVYALYLVITISLVWRRLTMKNIGFFILKRNLILRNVVIWMLYLVIVRVVSAATDKSTELVKGRSKRKIFHLFARHST